MIAHSRTRRGLFAALSALAFSILVITPAAAFNPDTEASVRSPSTPFSQNKQNEPTLAIDPSNPKVLVGGANDLIDLEACNAGDDTTCPFTRGVGLTGVYFSLNGGTTWVQPTYTGYSARGCLGVPGADAGCTPNPSGPIGTLPRYFENGLVSNGDPIAAFGPRPDRNGNFSWSNGSRLYFSNIATKFSARTSKEGFKGDGAIAVSRTDNVAAAAAGVKAAWKAPVIVTRQSAAVFNDKEEMWADNAASSPFFGNVYVCNVAFRSIGSAPEPVMINRSTDGGDTWQQRQISQAANANTPGRSGGRQGCVLRTDSQGTLYVFWAGSFKRQDVQWMARSWDGGVSFERPHVVAVVNEIGKLDPVQGRRTMDGVAGARSGSSFPTVSIANGAPSGAGATDRIVLAWPDAKDGLNHEKVLAQRSTDGGDSWSNPVVASAAGDRPDYANIAISPDGRDVYLVYTNHLTPWRSTTANPRLMQGVVRHAAGNLTGWADLHRGAVGDNRGSSSNGLSSEFLGDYNYAAATNDYGGAIWVDVRNVADCLAIDAYRQSLVDFVTGGPAPLPRPAPRQDCPATFGNTDIFAGTYADPT